MCVFYDPLCMEYGSNGVCSKAVNGFTISSMSAAQQSAYKSFIQAGSSVTNSNSQVRYNSTIGSYGLGGVISQYPFSGIVSQSFSTWNTYGEPLSCKQGFQLLNNRCIPTNRYDSNCDVYSDTGICTSCKPFFFLNA